MILFRLFVRLSDGHRPKHTSSATGRELLKINVRVKLDRYRKPTKTAVKRYSRDPSTTLPTVKRKFMANIGLTLGTWLEDERNRVACYDLFSSRDNLQKIDIL